jgi:hypothetical protein
VRAIVPSVIRLRIDAARIRDPVGPPLGKQAHFDRRLVRRGIKKDQKG